MTDHTLNQFTLVLSARTEQNEFRMKCPSPVRNPTHNFSQISQQGDPANGNLADDSWPNVRWNPPLNISLTIAFQIVVPQSHADDMDTMLEQISANLFYITFARLGSGFSNPVLIIHLHAQPCVAGWCRYKPKYYISMSVSRADLVYLVHLLRAVWMLQLMKFLINSEQYRIIFSVAMSDLRLKVVLRIDDACHLPVTL